MIIKPVTDLRNNFTKLEAIMAEKDEPIYLTKNGEGTHVIMDLSLYEHQKATMELHDMIAEAEIEKARTKNRISHKDMMNYLDELIDG